MKGSRFLIRAASLFIVGASVGCGFADQTTGPHVQGAALDIYDAVHGGGNLHFYFLPPMVPSTAYGGTSDPTVSPRVTVCEWSGTSCLTIIAAFSTTSGTGSEVVRYSSESYLVNWHTNECGTGACALDPAKTYRISVRAGIAELGHADVAIVNNGSQIKNVNTNEFVPLIDGRTLPIKFRIEQGAGGSVAEISGGSEFVCALQTSGTVACWGAVSAATNVPSDLNSVVHISAGGSHTCALRADQTVRCWGDDNYGQVSGPNSAGGVVQVSAGNGFTCLLRTAATVQCWGYNADDRATVPADLGAAVQVSAGGEHACAVKADATFRCWGNPGDDEITPPANRPVGPVTQISAGFIHTCALQANGIPVCWGDESSHFSDVPTGIGSIKQISAGGFHSCGLDSNGAVTCWGYSPFFEGATGATGVRQITAGYDNTCALKTDGTVVCWGDNTYGQSTVP